MGRRGENIHLRKDGRWEGRCSGRVDGKRKVFSVYARSYRAAKEKLAAKRLEVGRLQEASRGGASPEKAGGKILLDAAASEWLAAVKQKRKYSTYIKYSYIYQHYIYSKLGNAELSGLTDGVMAEKTAGNLAGNTLRGIYCVINQILGYASLRHHAPVRKLKILDGRAAPAKAGALDSSEQARLLRLLMQDPDTDKLGIYLCLATGLRLGEVCALRWSDIDMDLKVLHVNRCVQRVRCENGPNKTILIEGTPKTACSRREIPVSDHLYQFLARFKNSGAYLLNGERPMEPRTYQYKFARFLKAAGVEHKNFHILRHTFATNCIDSGADAKSVSEMLGHSDVSITLSRYVHPAAARKREYLNALTAVYGQAGGQGSL